MSRLTQLGHFLDNSIDQYDIIGAVKQEKQEVPPSQIASPNEGETNQEGSRVSTRALKEYFVLRHIKPIGLNPMILKAFEDVDRGDFIYPSTLQTVFPYSNTVIQLGEKGSSLSEPALLAKMIDLAQLTGREKVLDVGTGSGYMAAVLSRCSAEIHTIEYNERLVFSAAKRLDKLGFNTVHVHAGDGAKGVLAGAPYDAIFVTAGTREVPQTLFDQIKDGGVIVVPTVIGENAEISHIVRGVKYGNELHFSVFYQVKFHPLISDEHGGWSPQAAAKKRSYDIIFDDKQPKEFPKSLLVELTEKKKTAAGLEILEIFGMTLEYFTERMSERGWQKEAEQLILSPDYLHAFINVTRIMDESEKNKEK